MAPELVADLIARVRMQSRHPSSYRLANSGVEQGVEKADGPTIGPGCLLSVGYGGRRPSEFLDLLVENRVEVVVDVRLTPATRVPGFSGPALARSLPTAGIEYIHEPRLGNPVENRDAFRSGAAHGRARFESILESSGRSALSELVARATHRRVAVLCAERNDDQCHRQVIVAVAQQLSPGLAVSVLA